MNLERFVSEREPAWRELERSIDAARGRPERLGPVGIHRLGELYRGASADLALARRRFASEPVVRRLELLVARGRATVYGPEPRRETLRGFVARGYWRRVLERPVPILLAWALLLVPAAMTCVWALDDPAAAAGVVPEQFRDATGDDLQRERLDLEQGAAFSSQLFTNNIQVSFLAFAAGIAAGLGTAFVLVFNGVLIGALAGLAGGEGRAGEFTELIAAHGVLELSLVVVTAAAGMRIGWAVVDPGPRRRLDALVVEARRSIEVVLGSIPWFVVAGAVEALVTARLGLGGGLAFGLGLGAVYWGLVLWRGREPGPRRAAVSRG